MAMIAITIISSTNVNPDRRDMQDRSSMAGCRPSDSRCGEGNVHGFAAVDVPAERISRVRAAHESSVARDREVRDASASADFRVSRIAAAH
jgi:hypothetical protein